MLPSPRYLGLAMLVAMAGIVVFGYLSIRRDIENLRIISQDNILWTATQMEVELLRFNTGAAMFIADPTPGALDNLRERFDILWSRVSLKDGGRVGEILQRYDEDRGTIRTISEYLETIDPVMAALQPGASADVRPILDRMRGFQQDLRLFTLRVVRGDTSATAQVRDRIQSNARTTAMISGGAVLISLVSLFLILRENRRQRTIAEMNRRSAEEAILSNRAKSRFLTMMSHELRNPLNGMLGPLALLDQSEIPARLRRLVEQAYNSGQSMLQMLSGLLVYGEIEDGRFHMRQEPFRVAAMAEFVRKGLAGATASGIAVQIAPGTPELVYGDLDRFGQVFIYLGEYVLESGDTGNVSLRLSHQGTDLVGEIAFGSDARTLAWKFDLLMGLSEVAPDQVATESLRPLVARRLISAAKGVLTLVDDGEGRRAIRVALPAARVEFEQIRVHLETRSPALAAIYQAALRSDRVTFLPQGNTGPADLVLVDATSVATDPLMSDLRNRYAGALFVSLGSPTSPTMFDDVVETPNDMGRLRTSILGRLAHR